MTFRARSRYDNIPEFAYDTNMNKVPIHRFPEPPSILEILCEQKIPTKEPQHRKDPAEACRLYQQRFSKELEENRPRLSPQMIRLIERVINFDPADGDYKDLMRRVVSLANRFFLELVQAHHNTKQREKDVRRLIALRGGSIDHPKLTDAVISELETLKIVIDECSDCSFERNILISYLMEKLVDMEPRKKHVAKIVQTLYMCSCFNIIQRNNAPGHLEIKDEFGDAENLRQKHDLEIMKMAKQAGIRLPPESWAFLLYGCAYPGAVASCQSLSDKFIGPCRMFDLATAIDATENKLRLHPHLKNINELMNQIDAHLKDDTVDIDAVLEITSQLADLQKLFKIRQTR